MTASALCLRAGKAPHRICDHDVWPLAYPAKSLLNTESNKTWNKLTWQEGRSYEERGVKAIPGIVALADIQGTNRAVAHHFRVTLLIVDPEVSQILAATGGRSRPVRSQRRLFTWPSLVNPCCGGYDWRWVY